MPCGIPTCVHVPELNAFRVLRAKGKSFASGGYGVYVADENVTEDNALSKNDREDDDGASATPQEVTTAEKDSDKSNGGTSNLSTSDLHDGDSSFHHFLFIEEALFLHERGLIEVCNKEKKKLDSSQLFRLLEESDVALFIYLTYAHLRGQTFIVVRHTRQRLDLLRQISQLNGELSPSLSGETKSPISWKKRKRTTTVRQAKKELRDNAWNAPSPAVMTIHDDGCSSCETNNDTESASQIAFDVYQPNSEFRKTNPGPPSFYVAVTTYSQPSPPIPQLRRLVASCQSISLRIATVADSGTVIMFSMTDFGAPLIVQPPSSEK